ncbi:MAG TPA: hypothetical protein VFF69_09205 [Phycisphaerales bacterium]|nr:hypothetical protein [Phycisphaerales bacterium]
MIEQFEPRVVLAASHDLALVALTYDSADGFAPYLAELDWESDRSISGDMFVPGATAPQGPSPTTLSDLVNGAGGALRPLFREGDYDSTIGARIEPSADFPAGWIAGTKDDGSGAVFAAVVERAPSVTTEELAGTWTYQAVRLVGSNVYTYHGGFTSFNGVGGFIGFGVGAVGDDADPTYPGEGFEFVGAPERGRLSISLSGDDSAVFYVNRDKSMMLFADLDEDGGDLWIGVFMRQHTEVAENDLAGSYRGGLLADGEFTSELFGGPSAAWRLDLNANGTYRTFDLAAVDSGVPGSPLSQGAWQLQSGLAVLTDSTTGVETTLKLSDNDSSLILMQFRVASDNIFERPMGLFTRIAPDAEVEYGTTVVAGIFDAEGVPLVFDLREEDDAWSVVDLDRYALGEALGANAADVEAFQASDDRLVAIITTDDGVFAAERDGSDFWRAVNLTERIDDAENIVGTITVFTDKAGKSQVAGLTDSGEMVTYVFDPAAQGGVGEWSYLNLSDEYLTPQGEATPVFVGPLMSYVTDWNGLNIAGLDADGDIVAVWSGNGGAEWHAANLTSIINAPPMTSGLSAYLTGWGGINIVGLNSSGRVVAAWWVPGSQWRQADLTSASQGPTLTGDSLTSFVAPWGALNVAGLDANGDMIAYWWVPNNDNTWKFANLTAALPGAEPRPSLQLQSQTNGSHGGEMNILGTDSETGDLLRLYWRVEDGGAWQVQNVTADADYV